MALTKAKIVEQLFNQLGISMAEAKDLVEIFFEEIKHALESGQQVKLPNFGNFDLLEKKQRPGRNLMTGEDIPITPRRVVTFRPGDKLRARVEEGCAESIGFGGKE
ncbi:MAG: integration host factor subunit alpha [Pseudomonadota bacterium]